MDSMNLGWSSQNFFFKLEKNLQFKLIFNFNPIEDLKLFLFNYSNFYSILLNLVIFHRYLIRIILEYFNLSVYQFFHR